MKPNALGAFLLSLLLLAIPGPCFSGEAQPPERKTPSVGEKAPDFALMDFAGERFKLSEWTGRKGILLWFTNLCDGCRSKFADVEKLRTEYRDKGVEIVALSQLGEDRKTVEEAIRANRLTVRFLYDPKGEVTTRYSGRYVPGVCPLTNLYLIDKKGLIVYSTHYPGAPDAEILSRVRALGAVIARDRE